MSDVEATYALGDFMSILTRCRPAPMMAVVNPDDLLTFRIEGERVWFIGLGPTPETCQWFVVPDAVVTSVVRAIAPVIAQAAPPEGDSHP